MFPILIRCAISPLLATALERVLVSDVVGHRVEVATWCWCASFFREDQRGCALRRRAALLRVSPGGAYRADKVEAGSASIEKFTPEISAATIRTKPLEWFRESQRAVDLTAADIVSVGRGIKEAENIPIVQKLADALGAELAASRPICDNGWLPMERQVAVPDRRFRRRCTWRSESRVRSSTWWE